MSNTFLKSCSAKIDYVVDKMIEIISALDNIRNEFLSDEDKKTGLIFGEKWLETTKTKKCLISSHLTKKTIASLKEEDIQLIITIFPPKFIEQVGRILPEKMEFLSILIQQKTAVYSLGDFWFVSNDGGFDYLLKMLDFQYTSEFKLEYNDLLGNSQLVKGRLGERERKCKFKELVDLVQKNIDTELKYLGYNKHPIQTVAIFQTLDELQLERILENEKIDALIIGELSYEAKLELNLRKFPTIFVSRRSLENSVLAKIRRKIMEDFTSDLPELIVLKQDEIGVKCSK